MMHISCVVYISFFYIDAFCFLFNLNLPFFLLDITINFIVVIIKGIEYARLSVISIKLLHCLRAHKQGIVQTKVISMKHVIICNFVQDCFLIFCSSTGQRQIIFKLNRFNLTAHS